MNDAWDGILDPDERVIWQGAPKPRLKLAWDSPFHGVFFLFFTGFALFWMLAAASAGGFFWVWGLMFFGVGFYQLVLVHFWRLYALRRTHYTLTSKRAFIATQSPWRGRRLDSYPIEPGTKISFVDGTRADVFFAKKMNRSSDMPRDMEIGFESLTDGREVYSLIRKVQEGTA
ncbi:MAG: aspartate carbamoyltransferase catalytic subunit [Pseudomonadota bacterium]